MTVISDGGITQRAATHHEKRACHHQHRIPSRNVVYFLLIKRRLTTLG